MKKFLVIVAVALFAGINLQAHAETVIGYANYKKIEQNYEYAKKAYKEIDAKVLELQQFVIDKDKEFNVDTVLYNLMFEKRDLKYNHSLIPFRPLRRFIYNRDTQKAEKLAAEFNIDDKSKPLKVFINPFA